MYPTRALVGLLAVGSVVGCGGGGSGPGPAVLAVRISPENTLLVGVDDTTTLDARVVGAGGGTVSGAPVTWTSRTPGVVGVDASGHVTARDAGIGTVVGTSDGVEGMARVEVWIPPEIVQYEPGTSYFGRQEYVEYIPGRLPVVISAPHGGALEPDEISDRTYGTTVTDRNTRQTILAVRDAFLDRTGMAPHVIISHLRRTKLDPNREIVEAAQGNAFAENAWEEFHRFVETASGGVSAEFGSGLYFDLHGHGHDIARVEIGLLLSSGDLQRPDGAMDVLAGRSSIRALAARVDIPFADLVRGATSLGALLADRGIRSVPSPDDPDPGGNPYFSGGYNTSRHGSRHRGTVDGMQLELHYPGLRDTDPNRRAFASVLAESVESYMVEHYGFFAPAAAATPGLRTPVASLGSHPLH